MPNENKNLNNFKQIKQKDIYLCSSENAEKIIKVNFRQLCCSSKYFHNLFSSSSLFTAANKDLIIFLKDVPLNDLQLIVNFVCGDELKLTQTQVNSLLETAKYLGIDELISLLKNNNKDDDGNDDLDDKHNKINGDEKIFEESMNEIIEITVENENKSLTKNKKFYDDDDVILIESDDDNDAECNNTVITHNSDDDDEDDKEKSLFQKILTNLNDYIDNEEDDDVNNYDDFNDVNDDHDVNDDEMHDNMSEGFDLIENSKKESCANIYYRCQYSNSNNTNNLLKNRRKETFYKEKNSFIDSNNNEKTDEQSSGGDYFDCVDAVDDNDEDEKENDVDEIEQKIVYSTPTPNACSTQKRNSIINELTELKTMFNDYNNENEDDRDDDELNNNNCDVLNLFDADETEFEIDLSSIASDDSLFMEQSFFASFSALQYPSSVKSDSSPTALRSRRK